MAKQLSGLNVGVFRQICNVAKSDYRLLYVFLNEVVPLCIYIFTFLLLYITVNTTTIEYNANPGCCPKI